MIEVEFEEPIGNGRVCRIVLPGKFVNVTTEMLLNHPLVMIKAAQMLGLGTQWRVEKTYGSFCLIGRL